MVTRAEEAAEAYRRGLMGPKNRAEYEEAVRRGIVNDAYAAGRVRTGRGGAVESATGFMANVNRGSGIGDELAAAGGVLTGVLTGRKPLRSLANPVASYREELGYQRGTEDQYAASNPRAAALARGTGMAGVSALPAGPTVNLFATGGRMANAARGATLAAGQGALYAAADRGTAQERLTAASRAARDPVAIGVGAVGGSLATPRRARAPKPVAPDVEMLAREGVRMTPGQMRGGVAKAAEDAGTSQPFLGTAIEERRTEGLEDFTRALARRALRPAGIDLPDDVASGTAAIKYAGDKLSEGYETAIPGAVVRADPGFTDDVRTALANIDTLTEDNRARLADILNQRVTSRLPPTGQMDGRLYKQIQSDLDYEVGRFAAASDPDQRAMGDAIKGVQSALESAARRQDPTFAARIDALDRGWAELGRLETAAAKSADLSGIVTPRQYAQAVRAGDNRVRRRGVARGEALSQDFAGAAVRVLPSQIPDSGTAARGAWGMMTAAPGAVGGALVGGAPGALMGIGGTAATLNAASRMYRPEAIQAANAALASRIGSQGQREALAALAEMAARDPQTANLYREVAARLSGAAGVQAGAAATEVQPNYFARP